MVRGVTSCIDLLQGAVSITGGVAGGGRREGGT